MGLKGALLKELIKHGYSKEDNSRVWNIADRSFRYINKDMALSFLKLREHPRYKTTIMDIEIKLLKENILKFIESLGRCEFNLIDMGCIDGEKTKAIISSLPKEIKFRYCPVNVNEYLVKLAAENIKKESFHQVIDYAPRISKNFESMDQIGPALRNNKYQKNLLFMHSSSIASFDINDYLFRLSQSMLPGDILIIGNGIRKGPRLANLETYKHHIFNDWLIHLMRELGFKDEEVEYNARFENNRLEIYYTLKNDKIVSYEKTQLELRKEDKIIVAFQHKLYENELKDFCKMYFDKVELVKDENNEYALIRCIK